jgi:ribonuclease-3
MTAEDVVLAGARTALRAHLVAVVGEGEIPRLNEALTHPSFANEAGVADNQRLEFLGDAVLGLCVSEMLVRADAEADEGKLTRMRSALVNAEALAGWARRVGLGACLEMGRGARTTGERDQTNVLADATEAIVAAVYEARGLEGARALVCDIVGGLLEDVEVLSVRDPKSLLQERVQARGLGPPVYRIVERRGPPHELEFVVEVRVGDDALGRGEGRSKRLAEREAALAALERVVREESETAR